MFSLDLFGNKLVCEMIDFYVWKNYISLVNTEYHTKFSYRDKLIVSDITGRIVPYSSNGHSIYIYSISDPYLCYNYRILEHDCNNFMILNRKHVKVAVIPKFYIFSNGDKNLYRSCYVLNCPNMIRICTNRGRDYNDDYDYDPNCYCYSAHKCYNCLEYVCSSMNCSGPSHPEESELKCVRCYDKM
jgi:hypothetical protein